MPTGSTTLHEDATRLSPETRDLHRAIVSLKEELEAIDWYHQRMDATEDATLREILRHNRDEEMEHGALLLEWIRRHSPEFDTRLRGRLFTEGPILAAEESLEHAEQGRGADGTDASTATVGSPRTTRWTT